MKQARRLFLSLTHMQLFFSCFECWILRGSQKPADDKGMKKAGNVTAAPPAPRARACARAQSRK